MWICEIYICITITGKSEVFIAVNYSYGCMFVFLRGAELVNEHVRAQLDAVRREDKGKMDRIRKS